MFLSQKAFNEQFYEEDETEKPVFEDDLDNIGECCVRTVCVVHDTPINIVFICDDGMSVLSNDDKNNVSFAVMNMTD